MHRVIDSITTQHDYRLAAVAVLVCALAVFTLFSIYGHAVEDRRRTRRRWLLLAGVCAGPVIWAAQVLAILAYDAGVPTGYDPLSIGASLLAAAAATAVGCEIAVRGRLPLVASGGAVVGAGIGLVELIGMSALIVPGRLAWDMRLVAISFAIAIALASAAMIAFHKLRRHWNMPAAACLVALAIWGAHFAATAAMAVVPDLTALPHMVLMSELTMALVVGGLAVSISIAGIAAGSIQNQSRRESRARSRELADAALEGLALARDGVIVRVNRQLADLAGCAADQLIGKKVIGDLIAALPEVSRLYVGERIDATLTSANGTEIPVGVSCRTFTSASSSNEVYVIRDMTELRAREAELRTQYERFQTALANMSQGLAMFDSEQRLIISNDRYAEIYGLAPDSIGPGMTLRRIRDIRIANGVFIGRDSAAYIRKRNDPAALKTPSCRVQEMTDGRLISVSTTPMAGGGWVVTHEDVTERRRIEAKVEHLAHHDTLTDLPNRALFMKRLAEAVAGTRRRERKVAVFLLGLDRFKEVNETFGHPVGDMLLKEVAQRLRRCVSETDMVARLGGDEFAVLKNVSDAATDAAAMAKKIQATITVPFELREHSVAAFASIGVAIAPDDSTDAEQLLKNTSLALQRAKSERRGGFRFFEAEMDERMQARRNLERDLRLALANGELELHYQPQVNLQRNEVSGFEALLRWTHAERGSVPPSEFIPVAEETGLIGLIGDWVLREACAEATKWPSHMAVSVNLSPAQFKGRDVTQSVLGALAATGLPPDRLELEITETAMMQDGEGALATLTHLHDRGVRIALDDFGTGYSSLSYLRRFPFDKIKIDRSFIHDLSEDSEESMAIVRCVARLGDSLGMTTTAEGIETEEQLERVRAEGCTECQGYYFSAPIPASELALRYFASTETIDSAA